MVFRKSGTVIVTFVILGCGGGGSTGVATGGGGGGGGGTGCASTSICMTSASFEPPTLTVARGTTVTFVNGANVTHNVTFSSNAPTEGNIGNHSQGSNVRTMATSGTTKFFCSIHGTTSGGMTGEIIVQ